MFVSRFELKRSKGIDIVLLLLSRLRGIPYHLHPYIGDIFLWNTLFTNFLVQIHAQSFMFLSEVSACIKQYNLVMVTLMHIQHKKLSLVLIKKNIHCSVNVVSMVLRWLKSINDLQGVSRTHCEFKQQCLDVVDFGQILNLKQRFLELHQPIVQLRNIFSR